MRDACWNKFQLIAYRSVCGITGSVSTVGSSLIIYMICFRSKMKLTRVQNRLLLPMCIFDILGSIAQSISTLPMDTEQMANCPYYEGIILGNHATCTTQGFFYQLGMMVPCYNAALCYYYAMVIKWKKTDEEAKRLEPYLHALVLLPNFIVAAIALSNDLYGNMGVICFLTATEDEELSDGINKKKKEIFITVIGSMIFIIAAFIMTIIIYSMVAVYSTVKEQEEKMSVYRFHRPGEQRKKKSKLASTTEDTRIQAYLYVLGFFVTYLFPTICFIIYQLLQHVVPFPIVFLQGIFSPLQGFWNFLIFIRPRFNIVTKDHPEKSVWRRLLMTVFVKGRTSNGKKGMTRNNIKMMENANLIEDNSLISNRHGSFPKSSSTRHLSLNLECDPIPCIEESNSYCSDISHPVPPPIDSSNIIIMSKECIDNDDDDRCDALGPLSKLVAQDLFGSSILLPSSRRRSMIDFRLIALDSNIAWNKESDLPNIDYNEEDSDRNRSSMLDSFAGTKLVTGSSQQQRRKSCPSSLSFTWKEDEETATVRRGFGELDDIVIEASTSDPMK